MICDNCQKKANRIIQVNGIEFCNLCGGMSTAGGTRTDNILTRNSLRVRTEALKHEGETIMPHAYDKSRGKVGINKEFVKQFPNQAGEFFDIREMKSAGLGKLADYSEKLTAKRQEIKARESVEVIHGETPNLKGLVK